LSELDRYVDLDAPSTSLAAMIGAGWLHCMQTYLDRLGEGVPFLALRYNDLAAGRRAEMARLFDHAGLGAAGLDQLDAVFDEDSQKGTSIGRREGKRRLSEAQLAELMAVLGRHPQLSSPDLILPDIYRG